MLDLPFSPTVNAAAYTLTLTAGYILLLMSGVWISRMLKHNLMEDVFNTANESFMQETRLMENEYSVNLPTKFVYQGRERDGWINVVNPFIPSTCPRSLSIRAGNGTAGSMSSILSAPPSCWERRGRERATPW